MIVLDEVVLAGANRWGPAPAQNFDVTLPDELYLRAFMRLPTDSPEAVAEFVSEYGAFETPWKAIIPTEWTEAESSYDTWFDRHVADRFPEVEEIVRAEEARADQNDFGSFLVRSFQLKAGLLRDATRLWLSTRGNLASGGLKDHWESTWAYAPGDLDAAIEEFFIPVMNRALSPFRVAVYLPIAGQSPHAAAEYSTYNLLALQLANDVARNSEYHVCQKADCGRLFVHQEGRAKFGQHRTRGLKYCSTQCSSSVSSARARQKKLDALKFNSRGPRKSADTHLDETRPQTDQLRERQNLP